MARQTQTQSTTTAKLAEGRPSAGEETWRAPRVMTWVAALVVELGVACAVLWKRLTRPVTSRDRACPPKGSQQVGPYTLDEKIGEGGMGVVYRAHHELLKRPTAIKLLPSERAKGRDAERFEREVQLTSTLTHPNTISVYDFGRTADGTFYYAMEYLEGLDLQALVDQAGPQPPARVAHLLAQLCGALGEAHGVGLLHRDVKPANVFLCQRGGMRDVVKVLDFGLIKEFGPLAGNGPRTEVGAIVGTPTYMPPEAVSAPEQMDGRSDLYAVGALGYFLLTGAPPFSGKTVLEVCCQHLHSDPVPPSKRIHAAIPAELEQLILSCLAKAPEARPRDARALQSALLPLASTWTQEKAEAWWDERDDGVGAPCSLPAEAVTRSGDRSAQVRQAA